MRARYVVQVVPNEQPPAATSTPVAPTLTPPPVEPRKSAPEPPPVAPPAASVPRTVPRNTLPPVEPTDLFARRVLGIEEAFRAEHLQSARQEQTRVRVPKKRGEVSVSASVPPTSTPTERLEHLYQKTRFRTQTTPSRGNEDGGGRRGRLTFLRLRRPAGRWWTLLTILVLTAVILSGGTYGLIRYDIATAKNELRGLQDDIHNVRLKSAQERTRRLRRIVWRWSSVYHAGRPAVALLFGSQTAHNLDISADIARRGVETIETGIAAGEKVDTAFQEFAGTIDGDAGKTLQSVSGDLESMQTNLAALQAGFQRIDDNELGLSLLDMRKQALADIPKARRMIVSLQQLTQMAPAVLGESRKMQYLVLFQNNQELRPTGGFIGSFALVTVQNGKLLDFHVEDVYEADGQLNGYVTPPVEIIQYLGEEQWFLRDVNWSPDFPTVAQQAAWFLEKELGVRPDGVIGINLSVAQALLAATGPIEVPDYNEIITKDNLYERAEMHAEMNFFPGSTQKRDFLSAVANQLFAQIMSDKTNKAAIAEALVRSAEEAQILVSLTDPQVQRTFAALGWDGGIRTPNCPQVVADRSCQVDTVMQVEANVGVNKANEHVRRRMSHAVTLTSAAAEHERRIELQNTARSNAWPQGTYRTYIRWLVSDSAHTPEVLVNGQPMPADQIKWQIEKNKRVIGAYVEVPVESTAEIVVRYVVPLRDGVQAYALFEQKQSGTSDDLLRHEIELRTKNAGIVAPVPEIQGRTLIFRSQRRTHDFMVVGLE